MTGRANGRGRKSTRIKVKGPKPKVVRVRKGVVARVKSSSPSSTTTSAGSTYSCSQENVPSDTSETNFPYDIRFNGVSSLLNVIHKATPDVKDLLMDECEIILECRICRNLFRSFPNFLCHKQQFCQQQYNPASQSKYGPLVQCAENLYQLQYQVDASQRYSSSDNVNGDQSNVDQRQTNRLDMDHHHRESRLNKILTKLEQQSLNRLPYEREPSRNKRKLTQPCKSPCKINDEVSPPSLHPKIKLSIEPLLNRAQDGIAFQHVLNSENDSHCSENEKVKNVEDTAILGSNGKMVYLGEEKGAQMFLNQAFGENYDDCEMYNNLADLQCNLCQTQFYTEKTLRLHARKSSCISLRRSEVLNNRKHDSLDLTDSSYKTKVPSLRNNSKFTINPSPVKNLIVKKKTTNSRTDYNTAKENKSIVRSIFGPNKSPSKSSNIISSPVKSNRSIVRALGKAQAASYLSRINYGDERSAASQQSCSSSTNFTCFKCSSNFATKGELSSHLALCTGVINYAFLTAKGPPEQKKICIQIRHDYEKEKRSSLPSLNETSPDQIRQNSKTNRISQHNIPFNNNLNETEPSGGDSGSDSVNNVLQGKCTKELQVEPTEISIS